MTGFECSIIWNDFQITASSAGSQTSNSCGCACFFPVKWRVAEAWNLLWKEGRRLPVLPFARDQSEISPLSATRAGAQLADHFACVGGWCPGRTRSNRKFVGKDSHTPSLSATDHHPGISFTLTPLSSLSVWPQQTRPRACCGKGGNRGKNVKYALVSLSIRWRF